MTAKIRKQYIRSGHSCVYWKLFGVVTGILRGRRHAVTKGAGSGADALDRRHNETGREGKKIVRVDSSS